VTGLDELTRALGGPPAPGVAERLDDDALRELAAAVADARARQARALDDATATALDHVPRLLRGPIRRLVTG